MRIFNIESTFKTIIAGSSFYRYFHDECNSSTHLFEHSLIPIQQLKDDSQFSSLKRLEDIYINCEHLNSSLTLDINKYNYATNMTYIQSLFEVFMYGGLINHEFNFLIPLSKNNPILRISNLQYIYIETISILTNYTFNIMTFQTKHNFSLDKHNLKYSSIKSFSLEAENVLQEDHRLFLLPNRNIFILFSTIPIENRKQQYIDHIKENSMAYRIAIRKDNDEYELTCIKYLSIDKREKNWSPFIFQDSLYFIYQLNPLIIRSINKTINSIYDEGQLMKFQSKGNRYVPYIISSQYKDNILCESIPSKGHSIYGMYRLTTPLLYIRGRYLGFHHYKLYSKMNTIPHNGQYYFMGAFTIKEVKKQDKDDMYFQVSQISSFPITSNKYFKTSSDTSLFIVYPLDYWLEDGYDNTLIDTHSLDYIEPHPELTQVVICVGINDSNMKLVRISLDELLDSMNEISTDSCHVTQLLTY